jgi:TIR domain
MAGEEPVQIFISYAWDDNLVPPGAAPDASGFVTYLHKNLDFRFRDWGPNRPTIWRDVDNIYRGEQFLPKIKEQLRKSSLLIVVFSRNWLASVNCRAELEYFLEWRKQQNMSSDEDIILIAKNDVDLALRPPGVQNMQGYEFYEKTGQMKPPIKEFFIRGEPVSARYWPIFDELFFHLEVRTEHVKREKFVEPTPAPDGHTVYVAKPGRDMFDQYISVVAELTDKGFNVLPKRAVSLTSASTEPDSFIDQTLDHAEVSIHLLGENGSVAGESSEENEFVKVQLVRAAAKADRLKRAGGKPFHRIVWAPKVFSADPRSGGETMLRHPHDVLGHFDRERDADDVFGDNFGSFRDALVPTLDKILFDRGLSVAEPKSAVATTPAQQNPITAAVTEAAIATDAGAKILVLYDIKRDTDWTLARGIRKALRQENANPILAARDGDDLDRKLFDAKQMKECDAVVICWAGTSETWTLAKADEFENFRAIGRTRNWEPRSVVIGPPPGDIKNDFRDEGRPKAIDQVVVADDLQTMSSDEIRKLIPRRTTAAS